VSDQAIERLELIFGSEFPTERAPARAAATARASAQALLDEVWCDSEAPTGVAAERPILPRPPRAPRL
jgi:hypothetical protein